MGKDTIRKFDTLAKDMKGNAWEWIPARGYMRCLHGVANTLRKLHARSDPRDNKAAEESLALYQQLQRLQSTRKGFSSYVNFAYHLPEAYLRCGDDPGFNALWANAKLGADMCLYMSSQLGWVMSRVLQGPTPLPTPFQHDLSPLIHHTPPTNQQLASLASIPNMSKDLLVLNNKMK